MLLLQKWTKGIQDHVESCRKPAQETSAYKYHGATGGRVPVGIAEVPFSLPYTQTKGYWARNIPKGHEYQITPVNCRLTEPYLPSLSTKGLHSEKC